MNNILIILGSGMNGFSTEVVNADITLVSDDVNLKKAKLNFDEIIRIERKTGIQVEELHSSYNHDKVTSLKSIFLTKGINSMITVRYSKDFTNSLVRFNLDNKDKVDEVITNYLKVLTQEKHTSHNKVKTIAKNRYL